MLLFDSAAIGNTRKKRAKRHFTAAMRLELLQRAIAPWPRRQTPLLVINCGDGSSLRTLWHGGFDLVATEFDQRLRKIAFARKVPDLELFAAREDDLPFENDSFDWAVFHVRDASLLNDGIDEALRVAKRGIMLTFWNKASLAAIMDRFFPDKRSIPAGAISWRQASTRLRSLHAGSLTLLSTLLGPGCSWTPRFPLARANGWLTRLPFGAWCVARLDLGRISPLTPMALRFGKQTQPQPVMEYAHKKVSQRGSASL